MQDLPSAIANADALLDVKTTSSSTPPKKRRKEGRRSNNLGAGPKVKGTAVTRGRRQLLPLLPTIVASYARDCIGRAIGCNKRS